VTKQQIYDTIVSLTAEIKATDVATKLFEAAKSEDGGQKVKEVRENFITQNSILYEKMMNFASEVNQLIEESETGNDAEVFDIEQDEENGIFMFDLNVIDASSYFAFTFLSGIDDSYFFTVEYYIAAGTTAYFDALEEKSGSSELVNFLAIASFIEEEFEFLEFDGFKYSNFDDLLADVFAGKLKEYLG